MCWRGSSSATTLDVMVREKPLALGLVCGLLVVSCGGCPSSPSSHRPPNDSNSGHTVAPPADGLIAARPPADGGQPVVLEVATGHPRLWVRADELPKLRSWANKRNPIYAALTVAAGEAIGYYRGGQVPSQECAHKNQYCESYAMMFAFMSLLERDGKRQREWAEAARAILMHMVGRVNANASGDVLAAPRFSRHDRSRWAGEGFALTVDWIYPFLSKDDKQAIRKVFLRWAEELLVADTTGIDHPPKGGFNDPVLLADRKRRRYAANNYYTSHLRNLTLMAMAFDAADDPDQPEAGRTYPNLRAYLRNATGKWLFMTDSVLRNDARGGLAPEGIEYAARTLAFVSQTYLGLQTAGHQDVELPDLPRPADRRAPGRRAPWPAGHAREQPLLQ